MFELLTKYIGVLNDENSGEWIIDQTHKGDYSGPLRATCPEFESHHSGE